MRAGDLVLGFDSWTSWITFSTESTPLRFSFQRSTPGAVSLLAAGRAAGPPDGVGDCDQKLSFISNWICRMGVRRRAAGAGARPGSPVLIMD